MKRQQQSVQPPRFTVFKPPKYIYRLSKYPNKSNPKTLYETYFNQEYSLRKYHRTLPITSQTQLIDYEWRKQTLSPIVRVVYLELLNKTISKSTSEAGVIELNVYTEQIQKILADMIDLNLSQSIYVLKECLCAYRQLFTRFSAVSISKFYCGLNAQGKLKVWINENFALNCPIQCSAEDQQSYSDILTTQAAIVNKIVYMVGLLASSSCQFFFFGLTQELTVKRFTFNNCLQYVNSIVANTKSVVIPTDLSYMLPKRNFFEFEKSNNKFMSNTKFTTILQKQRRASFLSPPSNTSSFKQFVPFSLLSSKKSAQNDDHSQKKSDQATQNKFRFKRYSQQLPNNFTHIRFPSKPERNLLADQNPNIVSKKQCQVSLHVIVQKDRRNSAKVKQAFQIHKSNISLHNQRLSISVVPAFISKSVRGNNPQKEKKSIGRPTQKSQKSKNSYSIQSNKEKGCDSLVNSKVGSLLFNNAGLFNKYNTLFRTLKPKKAQRLQTQEVNSIRQSQPENTLRARSASANLKFGCTENYLPPQRFLNFKNEQNNLNVHKENTTRSHYEKGQKNSMNSISNQGNAKRRSFLTRTNYDSSHDENEKNQSFCRMDFSSMSIDNKITNKNFESDITHMKKQDMKRSLMSYKFGFEQILQNPSCKEVEEENQTKSYNGSSLRNTQNIAQQLAKMQKINEETTSNNYSQGNNSSKAIRRHLNDSVQENWDMIKQKNDQVLIKNQWKKTINNLGELEQIAVNESIIDASNEIVRRDQYAEVRLQKLERLGRNMCFSIVKKPDDGAFGLNSSQKRSEGM